MKRIWLFSVACYLSALLNATGIDMQAHVASDEGLSAYTAYQSKQSAYYIGQYTYSLLVAQTGNTLFGTINALMGETCDNGKKGKGFNYDNLRQNYINVDKDLNNSSCIIGYYDGSSFDGTWDSGETWNREHTWPQSKFKGSYSSGSSIPIGYDMQSVRPASMRVNSGRGNKAYGEGSTFYDPNGIAIDNINYKPINNGTYRGDAARVILYDYVVYGQWGTFKNYLYDAAVNADLLTQLGSDPNAVFESLAILLKWHMQDPPSLTEMVRNDGAATYQGNRNPFVDYPELAINLLKDEADVPVYTVSNSSEYALSPSYAYTTGAGFVTYVTDHDSHPAEIVITGTENYTYEPSLGRLTINSTTGNIVINSPVREEHTIRWHNLNDVTEETYYDGDPLEFPEEPEACNGRTFVGWSAQSEISDPVQAPTDLFTSVAGMNVTADADYYAVFATQRHDLGNNYSKINSVDDFTTANYVIVGFTTNYYAMKSETKASYYINATEVIATDDIIRNPNNDIVWQVKVTADKASFYHETSDQYLYLYHGTKYNLGLTSNTDSIDLTYFNFGIENGQWIFSSIEYTDYQIEYYTKYNEFSAYTGQGSPIYVYKQTEDISYEKYSTVCAIPDPWPTDVEDGEKESAIDINDGVLHFVADKVEDISIYNALGMLVAQITAAEAAFNLQPGIYVLQTQQKSTKILIR